MNDELAKLLSALRATAKAAAIVVLAIAIAFVLLNAYLLVTAPRM